MVHDEQHDSSQSKESHRPSRAGDRCYQIANRLARVHRSTATRALVLGARDPSFMKSIEWIASCKVIDIARGLAATRREGPRDDFLTVEVEEPIDLVFCIDTLNRVPHPGPFLRKLLHLGDLIVAVPFEWPSGPEVVNRHNPIDEVRLLRRARRRWLESEIFDEDDGRRWLVALFRGDTCVEFTPNNDFGLADDERSWLDDLVSKINAVQLPRRRSPFRETVVARLNVDDPLRSEITGSFGVYAVRALCNALGFDEHRKFNWRLEHKLVQARVFNHYLGREFAASWGVDGLVRRGLATPLIDALLAGRLFAKEALGHLSGDFGEAEATHDVLHRLIRDRALPRCELPAEETWLVQERIAINREYRVHSLEDHVLIGMTFDRYGPFPVPEGRDEVNAYVTSILRACPTL